MHPEKAHIYICILKKVCVGILNMSAAAANLINQNFKTSHEVSRK